MIDQNWCTRVSEMSRNLTSSSIAHAILLKRTHPKLRFQFLGQDVHPDEASTSKADHNLRAVVRLRVWNPRCGHCIEKTCCEMLYTTIWFLKVSIKPNRRTVAIADSFDFKNSQFLGCSVHLTINRLKQSEDL